MKSSYADLVKFVTLPNAKISKADLDLYHQKTVEFCRQWYTGQDVFELKTSGSTGIPKTITVTRQQMIASAAMTKVALNLKPGYNALVCLNTDLIAGKMMLVRGLEIGMQMYITYPDSNPFMHLQDGVKIDFAAMVPYQIQTILEKSPKKTPVLNSMKALIIGGAAVSESLVKIIQNIQTPVYSTYGMTETVSHIALKKLNGSDASEAFTTLPGIKISQDERGCLTIKGQVTNNSTITTNDVVELLNDQQFTWKGRADNIINSGGVKIQLEELELKASRILQRLNISNRFMISGLADKDFGTVVVLLIEGNLSPEIKAQLSHLLRTDLHKYETPKEIYYVDFFKETQSGKVDRNATKDLISV